MLAYYVLTKGGHPFGNVDYERRKNIVDGDPGMNLATLHCQKYHRLFASSRFYLLTASCSKLSDLIKSQESGENQTC